MRAKVKNLHTEQLADVTVIRVPGPAFDRRAARAFRGAVRDLLPSCGGRVLFDLCEVQSLSSAGLGALLECATEMRCREIDLRLCGPTPAVRTLFELVRLHHIVDLSGSRDAALAAWSRPARKLEGLG